VFRQGLAARIGALGGSPFHAEALSPVLLLAGQPDVSGWLPIVVEPEEDCIAPVVAE
jgi:hypothetical protein